MTDGNQRTMNKYAVVFLAWGKRYLDEVDACISQSKALESYDRILITDAETELDDLQHRFTKVIRASFETQGLLRKTELVKFLPDTYAAYVFLDSDTVVIDDISLGFEKAEKFSIAVAPAPHYSLDYFRDFDHIMDLEGTPCKGQLQFNTGVIFFKNSPAVKSVFQRWMELAHKYQAEFKNDQPFFSLAMEQLDINPYTLSISYNYRGRGDSISGVVRVWHSHGQMPANINDFNYAWPPRKAWPSKVVYPTYEASFVHKNIVKIRRLLDRWKVTGNKTKSSDRLSA